MTKLRIPQATSKGYVEVPVGGVFDGSYLTSKTRRGRVQGGGMLCPTLCAGESEIYVFEGVIDGIDSDREHSPAQSGV